MSKEENKEEQDERKNGIEMLMEMVGMVQYMANAINLEAAGIIHNGGWCKELITSECPICRLEANKDGNNDEQ